MSGNGNASALKKPIGIYILALLFIIAPLGNILISFAGSGITEWYQPSIFFAFIQTIPAWEWAWLGLLALTGILLFRPHKLSWSFAILTLVLILCINIYRIYTDDASSISPQYLKVFSILALFCTLGVLVIAFYFRFPYLDRRANWIKNVERFDLTTEVKIGDLVAITDSVSSTGCRIITPKKSDSRAGDIISVVFTEIDAKAVKCEVIDVAEKHLRLEFSSYQENFKMKLKQWIKTKS